MVRCNKCGESMQVAGISAGGNDMESGWGTAELHCSNQGECDGTAFVNVARCSPEESDAIGYCWRIDPDSPEVRFKN